jgi:hypothetical protein
MLNKNFEIMEKNTPKPQIGTLDEVDLTLKSDEPDNSGETENNSDTVGEPENSGETENNSDTVEEPDNSEESENNND